MEIDGPFGTQLLAQHCSFSLEIVVTLVFIHDLFHLLRGAAKKKKRFFLGDLSQMWVGGVAESQTRSKPLKKTQITPKIALFDPNFPFHFFSNLTKTLGWVGG